MITFLTIWYALGWAGAGIRCHVKSHLTLCELWLLLTGGGLSVIFMSIEWLDENRPSCPIIWRRK